MGLQTAELTDGTDPEDTCNYNSVNQIIGNVGVTWEAADCDGDSVENGQELINGTSPTDTCSYTGASFNVLVQLQLGKMLTVIRMVLLIAKKILMELIQKTPVIIMQTIKY